MSSFLLIGIDNSRNEMCAFCETLTRGQSMPPFSRELRTRSGFSPSFKQRNP